MGLLGKKKKKKEEIVQPEDVPEAEPEPEEPEVEEELPTAPNPPKKEKVAKAKQEPKGAFSLNEKEMALAVEALASRPELKVYNDFIIGNEIAKIITAYNKATAADEEQLPTE